MPLKFGAEYTVTLSDLSLSEEEVKVTAAQPLGVAMIGTGFMGAAHSQARRVAPRFFDLPLARRCP